MKNKKILKRTKLNLWIPKDKREKKTSGIWGKDLLNVVFQTPVKKHYFLLDKQQQQFSSISQPHKYIAISEGF